MGHLRRPLLIALMINTAIFSLEVLAGMGSNSVSLAMDGIHNLSDEGALLFLFLAYSLSRKASPGFVRTANLLNTAGLLVVSAFMVWQGVDRLLHPKPILGWVPVVVGLMAAAGNYAVARALRGGAKEDAAIQLAYVHNLGDAWISFGPVLAGILILWTGVRLFDVIIAIALAGLILVPTLRTVMTRGADLVWPATTACANDAKAAT